MACSIRVRREKPVRVGRWVNQRWKTKICSAARAFRRNLTWTNNSEHACARHPLGFLQIGDARSSDFDHQCNGESEREAEDQRCSKNRDRRCDNVRLRSRFSELTVRDDVRTSRGIETGDRRIVTCLS